MGKIARRIARRHQQRQNSSPARPAWIWGALLVLGVALLAFVAVRAPGIGQRSAATDGQGPRIAVDQEQVDYGDVKVETPIRTVFTVQNVGDSPLHFLGAPQVEVVEGC